MAGFVHIFEGVVVSNHWKNLEPAVGDILLGNCSLWINKLTTILSIRFCMSACIDVSQDNTISSALFVMLK